MTKEDILNMKTSYEVGRTLKTHFDIWDDEVNEYWISLSKKERKEKYGSEDILIDPPRRSAAPL